MKTPFTVEIVDQDDNYEGNEKLKAYATKLCNEKRLSEVTFSVKEFAED